MPLTRKNKRATDLQIEVEYRTAAAGLTEAEKKQLIKNIKKSNDYLTYLSRKFKFAFEDKSGCTKAVYLWKGGAGDQNEATDRVIELLVGRRPTTNVSGNLLQILPEGVSSKLIKTKNV